jgi:hypothetical protein
MAQTRETNLHVILFCSCVVVKLSWQKRELNVDATVAVFGTILSETWRLHTIFVAHRKPAGATERKPE